MARGTAAERLPLSSSLEQEEKRAMCSRGQASCVPPSPTAVSGSRWGGDGIPLPGVL